MTANRSIRPRGRALAFPRRPTTTVSRTSAECSGAPSSFRLTPGRNGGAERLRGCAADSAVAVLQRGWVVLGAAFVLAAWAPPAQASWPFPTPPFPLGAPPTMLSATEEDELLVGRRGAVLRLSTRADGSLAVRDALTLPDDAVPIAAVDTALVLDATTSSVLVFEGNPPAGRLVAALPVGPAPSALAVAGDYVAVANAGSNDVSLFRRGDDNQGPWLPAGTVPVGREPRAIVAGEFAGDYNEDLAVANAGAGTVTILAQRDRGGFARSADITVGGAPHALTVAPAPTSDADEIIVGPTANNSLVALARGRRALRIRRTIPLPGAVGPFALALGAAVDEGDRRDLAVADRGAGGVWLLRGNAHGGFTTPTLHGGAGEPIAVTSELLGGDFHVDFAMADAKPQTVSLLVTPGDRLLSAPGDTVGALAAGGGRLVWSRRAGPGDHRLIAWRSGTARELPIGSSTRPLLPQIGRLAPNDPVATYVRCTVRKCAAFAWHFRQQRERRLRLPIQRECAVNQVAAWDRHRAFTLTRPWNTSCHSTGLWLQSRPRPARRIDASGRFGALMSGRLAWLDLRGDSWRVRVMTIGRRTRTVTRGNLDCCSEGIPTLSRRIAYYTAVGMDGEQTLPLYADPAPTPPCSRTRHDYAWFDGVPSDDYYSARFAVDGRRIYYADARGVWRIDPRRMTWHCNR